MEADGRPAHVAACKWLLLQARHAAEFGVHIPSNVNVDFCKVMERMRTLHANFSPIDSCDRFQNKLGIVVFQVRQTKVGSNLAMRKVVLQIFCSLAPLFLYYC